jgi:hypothetical protein
VPVPFNGPVPSVVVPLRKVTVPVGAAVVPEGGATTAVNVTLLPDAMLELLDVSIVVETRGVVVTVVLVSGLVFAASILPALSVAML